MMWQKWEQKGGVVSPTGVLWVAVLQRRAGEPAGLVLAAGRGASVRSPTLSVSPSGREGTLARCWELLGVAVGKSLQRADGPAVPV